MEKYTRVSLFTGISISPYTVDRGRQMSTVVAIGTKKKGGQTKLDETGMAVSVIGFCFKIH